MFLVSFGYPRITLYCWNGGADLTQFNVTVRDRAPPRALDRDRESFRLPFTTLSRRVRQTEQEREGQSAGQPHSP